MKLPPIGCPCSLTTMPTLSTNNSTTFSFPSNLSRGGLDSSGNVNITPLWPVKHENKLYPCAVPRIMESLSQTMVLTPSIHCISFKSTRDPFTASVSTSTLPSLLLPK
uniref:Uncharacterized protein MANES_16G057200 n=1 Tax=Rhizophora mucronata TaxID=61149 RepID=A0A2P2LML6_RHIMU